MTVRPGPLVKAGLTVVASLLAAVTSATVTSAAASSSLAPTHSSEGVVSRAIPTVQDLHDDAQCAVAEVPVSVSGAKRGHIYGELCIPLERGPNSSTVQLLVAGSTYNHRYFDMPVNPRRYSYVSDALSAGYATFNVDRLATGKSTLPASRKYNLTRGTRALHQVIRQLRSGVVGPAELHHSFDNVIFVGHSLGSAMGWLLASHYDNDIDAFVLTGMSHTTIEEEDGDEPGTSDGPPLELPAMDDPKFAGTVNDPGYFTTTPGIRQFFYYAPNASTAVIKADERFKDLSTRVDSRADALVALPARRALSRSIRVPVLTVVGEYDLYCGATMRGRCTSRAMERAERAYYRPDAQHEVFVAKHAGHSVTLHRNAPSTNRHIQHWLTELS